MRPKLKVHDDGTDGVPLHLLAGRCIETWSPERLDWHEASRRYQVARREWNDAHPDRPLAPRATWSYDYVLQTRGAAEIADRLERLGLPAGWTPTAV